ncbi:Hypothetical_protein [Hexamita inflata]|uniref:Hypothetical_protein n=1 Tax=Hexamita inflata TaxID=28002 RepID=A0AA86NDI9_9EUKA|nr:Hypothetical protein HINF_LOCUS5170 [Hexamita inflata]
MDISNIQKANSSASGVSTPLFESSQSEDSLKRVYLFQTEYYRLFIYLGCRKGLVYHCASDTYCLEFQDRLHWLWKVIIFGFNKCLFCVNNEQNIKTGTIFRNYFRAFKLCTQNRAVFAILCILQFCSAKQQNTVQVKKLPFLWYLWYSLNSSKQSKINQRYTQVQDCSMNIFLTQYYIFTTGCL